jgi:hypothetical protein
VEFQQAFNISRGLEHGFAAFKRVPFPMFLGALLMQCTEGGSGGGGNSGGVPWDAGSGDDGSRGMDIDYRLDSIDPGELLRVDVPLTPGLSDLAGLGGVGLGIMVAAVLIGLVCVGLIWVFRSWLQTGYIRLQVSALRSGDGSFGDLFSGADRLVPMMLWKLLKTMVTLGAMLVSGLPGGGLLFYGAINRSIPMMGAGGVLLLLLCLPVLIYIGLGLAFGEHAVTLDELGPTEALERSWQLASGNRLQLFLFLLVYAIARFVAAIVGLLMLCVGALVTIPVARAVTDTGFTESYLLLTGKAGLDDLAGVFD